MSSAMTKAKQVGSVALDVACRTMPQDEVQAGILVAGVATGTLFAVGTASATPMVVTVGVLSTVNLCLNSPDEMQVVYDKSYAAGQKTRAVVDKGISRVKGWFTKKK